MAICESCGKAYSIVGYWMSDKPLVQQALSSELANLLLQITSTDSALSFLRGFWESTVYEWGGIDRLRMDKYYMLARKYLYASFLLLGRLQWEENVCRRYNQILTERGGPLCCDDPKLPMSLVYHLADIYSEELDKSLRESEQERPVPLPLLLHPFISMMSYTHSAIAFSRINEALLEPLLHALATIHGLSSENVPTPIPVINKGSNYTYLCMHVCVETKRGQQEPAEVGKAILQNIFAMASHEDTRDTNRRKLYAIWKMGMFSNEDGPQG